MIFDLWTRDKIKKLQSKFKLNDEMTKQNYAQATCLSITPVLFLLSVQTSIFIIISLLYRYFIKGNYWLFSKIYFSIFWNSLPIQSWKFNRLKFCSLNSVFYWESKLEISVLLESRYFGDIFSCLMGRIPWRQTNWQNLKLATISSFTLYSRWSN